MKKLIILLTLVLLSITAQAGEFTKVGVDACGKGIYVQRKIIGYTHCRQPIYTSHVTSGNSYNTYHRSHGRGYSSYNRGCNSSYRTYSTRRTYSTHSTYSTYRPYNRGCGSVNVNYRSKHWNVNYRR